MGQGTVFGNIKRTLLEVDSMDYEIEELLPLVSELAQKYSGYESTSITYEKAQALMGAILYCLEEYKKGQANSLASKNISIKEQYDIGTRLVYEKAKNIQKIFNELSLCFESYGVKCLYDTVQKGIPQFLKWYDVKYNPQDTILTLDYPLLIDCSSLSGADAVYKYILAIQTEQYFLGAFDKEYVLTVLKSYNPQYEYMIENICAIVLSNTIGHVAIKKPLNETDFQKEDYLQLAKLFEEKTVSEIEGFIKQIIREMAKGLFGNYMDKISEYLCYEARNIAVRIETASKHNEIHKIFII